MKVLVASTMGQGARESDFSWTVDGELVVVPFQCNADGDDFDGGCGCRRAMLGMSSSKATTTFMVVERPITRGEYFDAIHGASERDGWGGELELVEQITELLLGVAADHAEGAVLERRGEEFVQRL